MPFDPPRPLPFWKVHAYGNDFLYVPTDASEGLDLPELTRRLCERHTGLGADGVIYFTGSGRSATMRLLNADGSPSEVSGNGVRGLAAIVAEHAELSVGECVEVATEAGGELLTLVGRDGDRRPVFRADMGLVEDLRQVTLDVAGESVEAVAMRVGNPQCVILAPELDTARLHRIGRALQHHPEFPEAVNVELAHVENPGRVNILIWERGVGPTESSGTGSCASGVAAAAFGGAANDLEVVAPGGIQRVEWREGGPVFLTGWAEIVARGEWLGARPGT
jgi:diaminopimelate epimerase